MTERRISIPLRTNRYRHGYQSVDDLRHVISLGAGVQSTTMALMASQGAISPMPECAIFADTGEEPKRVYEHLSWLMERGRLPFPVYIVRAWEGYGAPSIRSSLGDSILSSIRG